MEPLTQFAQGGPFGATADLGQEILREGQAFQGRARFEKAVSDVSETAALPFLHGSAQAGLRIDLNGVDAVVNGVARSILRGGGALRKLQTGVVTHYVLAMIAGVIAAIAVFAVAWR